MSYARDNLSSNRMANAAIKFGLPALGLGLLSFLALFLATGGVASCANDAQMGMLFLGLSGLGIGVLVFLVSLSVALIRKYKARHLPESSDM
jgi:hypothetical protein